MNLKKFDLTQDIYYNPKYISLYIQPDSSLFEFSYKEDDQFFIQRSIKKPITQIGNVKVKKQFFDLETAYGYGGIYTNSHSKSFLENAIIAYEKKCKEENVIAEFFRFHPFNFFPQEHNEYFDLNIYDRDIVIVDLSQDILASYRSKVRNIVNKSINSTKFKESKNIDKFIEIYISTMKKNNAENFYYFDKEYFQKLLLIENVKLYELTSDNKTIAMGFFIFSENLVHYHLSANTPLSYKLNGNYALLHNIFLQAQKEGKKYCILGGGTTNSQDDSLFKFKKKFSSLTKPFYISGKIYDKKVYNEYVKLWEQQSKKEIKYFLKYRLDI